MAFLALIALVVASWIAGFVVLIVVLRSLLLPAADGGPIVRGGAVADGIGGAENANPRGRDEARIGGDRHLGAVVAIMARWGPPLIAIILAVVSLPLVAHSLHIFDTSNYVSDDQPFLAGSDARRWTAAAGAAILSAAIAGTIGAPAVRRNLVTGAAFTFLLALIAAIATFPIMPSRFGEHVGEVLFCIDGCNAIIDSGDAFSGLRAAPFFALAPFVEPAAVAALAVGVGVWSLVVRQLSDAASQRRSD